MNLNQTTIKSLQTDTIDSIQKKGLNISQVPAIFISNTSRAFPYHRAAQTFFFFSGMSGISVTALGFTPAAGS